MSHYFTSDEGVKSQPHLIEYTISNYTFSLISDYGVFSQGKLDRGSEALLKHLTSINLSGTILDLGAGIGVIGITLKTFFPELKVIMLEINERAIKMAKENIRRDNLADIEVRTSDVCSALRENEKFVAVVTNPPIRAGKNTVYRMFKEGYDHLFDGGSLFFVMRKSHGAPSAQKFVAELFGNCELVKRDHGYYIFHAVRNNEQK